MAKLRSVITAYKAQLNPETTMIDILGSFDNLIQPMFPFGLPNLSIVLTMEELKHPTMFEVRVNAPDGSLVTKGEFGILPDPFGVGKKILDLEKFVIVERGKYTIDILEKVAEDKVKFIVEADLFIADYAPQRNISDEEKEAILAADGVIKTVKSDFKFTEDMEPIKIQVNLDKNAEIEEGYMAIPENDRITIDEKIYDLTGIRRQIEWMFGRPIPKSEDENKKEEEK